MFAGKMTIALIIIAIGVVFLLQNLGFFSSGVWGVIWPLALIIVGLAMLTGHFMKKEDKKDKNEKEKE